MEDDFVRGLSDLRERFEQGRSTVKDAVSQHVSAIDEAIGALHDIKRTFQACGAASEEDVKARLVEIERELETMGCDALTYQSLPRGLMAREQFDAKVLDFEEHIRVCTAREVEIEVQRGVIRVRTDRTQVERMERELSRHAAGNEERKGHYKLGLIHFLETVRPVDAAPLLEKKGQLLDEKLALLKRLRAL